jgi:iron complex outermembrane receptor protein
MDELQGSFTTSMNPAKRDMHTFSWFVQDDMTIIEDKLRLIIGSKMEHNDFTGFEMQPSGRLLWTPNKHETIWAAATHAVRTPTRSDSDTIVNYHMAGVIYGRILGNENIQSETVDSFELGYRVKPNDKLLVDITGFYNEYDDLVTTKSISNIAEPPYTFIPVQNINGLDGETYGGEVSVSYHVNDNWRLNAGYSFIQMQLHRDDSSASSDGSTTEGETAHNQFHLRSYANLTNDVELDLLLNYVDNLPAGNVNHYLRLDARLGWHITEDMELSIVVQNLLNTRHTEYYTMAAPATNAQRAFYAKFTYKF